MLSFDTRNRLVDILLAIADGERQIEVVRQLLAEQEDFEPYAAFKRIDRLRKSGIDAVDIMNFLSDNKVYYNEHNCQTFIRRYDVDGDNRLDYTEFLYAILPMDNPTLRTIATQRPNYDVAEDQVLTYDIEYSLAKVIDREIAFYIGLDSQKYALLDCRDFNYLDAFSTIDRQSNGKIDFVNLGEFFRRLSIYPTEEELIAILRRFDRDDDGRLHYDEFVRGLEPVDMLVKASTRSTAVYSPSRRLASASQNFGVSSPSRRTTGSLRKQASPYRTGTLPRASSPIRRPASPLGRIASPYRRVASPERRVASPTRRVASPYRRVASPERRVASPTRNVASPRYTGISSPSRRIASPTRRVASPYRRVASPERRVASPTRRIASPTRRIASPTRIASPRRIASPTRASISYGRTSPLRESYRQTTYTAQESRISPVKFGESQYGFRNTGGSYRVASPLRTQQATNSSYAFRASPLRKSELGGGITAKSPARQEILRRSQLEEDAYNQRLMKSLEKPFPRSEKKDARRATFQESEAREGLIQALKQFLQLEKELEAAKQDLSLRPDFNLLDFFRIFDGEGRGSISSSELGEGLRKFGLYPNKEELYLFLRRFDRDNDGKLKFSDFTEAFTCKQQEYAMLLNNRIPINADLSLDMSQTFSEETRKAVTRLLRMHLDNEGTTEALRQRLARRYNFNVHEGFTYLDLNEDGFITIEELGTVLDKNDFYATQRELKLLMDRLDANRDGKITYSEFVQEMTPKSEKTF